MRFLFAALGVLLATLAPASLAFAQEQDRSFPETGYTVTDDAIWTYFTDHGGVATFGAPISRETTLSGSQVQLFEYAALIVQPDGSVQPMQLADTLPYQRFDGLTVPAVDPALTFVAPSPDQPNYAARLAAYLSATVGPQFASAYSTDVLGLPTSSPKADPNNPNFVYQRFQNGILMADASSGTVAPLPLGQYFKAVLTGAQLPPDLASEAAQSPLLRQLVASDAFTPDL
jgi:hypothetical protein